MKRKNSLLFVLLGTVLVLIAAVGATVLTYYVFRLFFALTQSDGKCAAMLTSSYAIIFIFVIIFEVFLLTFNITPAKKDPTVASPMLGRQNGMSSGSEFVSKKGLTIVRIVCLAITLAVMLISANIYTVYSDSGIKKNYVVTTKEYEWKNVRSYSVTCEENGGFVFTLNMKDNSSYTLASTFHDSTAGFKESYADIYDYAVYVDEQLKDLQITKRVTNVRAMEDYYKTDFPDIWEKIKVIIDYDRIEQE